MLSSWEQTIEPQNMFNFLQTSKPKTKQSKEKSKILAIVTDKRTGKKEYTCHSTRFDEASVYNSHFNLHKKGPPKDIEVLVLENPDYPDATFPDEELAKVADNNLAMFLLLKNFKKDKIEKFKNLTFNKAPHLLKDLKETLDMTAAAWLVKGLSTPTRNRLAASRGM